MRPQAPPWRSKLPRHNSHAVVEEYNELLSWREAEEARLAAEMAELERLREEELARQMQPPPEPEPSYESFIEKTKKKLNKKSWKQKEADDLAAKEKAAYLWANYKWEIVGGAAGALVLLIIMICCCCCCK